MDELKKTPLYSLYKEQGVKLVDFGGWAMPVYFSSILAEHEAVRTKAGLFDVSHMGEIAVQGSGALRFLQEMMTNDVSKLKKGAVQYTAMCDESGGTIDDLLIYKLREDDYLLVVNAANTNKDLEWLFAHLPKDVSLTDRSSEIAQMALQGPKAEQILQKLTSVNVRSLSPFAFLEDVEVKDVPCLISRTGYTGEDGFELYCRWVDAPLLWKSLLDAGEEEGLLPCGLGARDTLRFEAKLPLYGQELGPEISPIEAGIGFAVKVEKEANFVGKDVLKKQKERGPKRKIAGIEMIERAIPRIGHTVFANNQKIGKVTSGTHSPTLKKNIGLALLAAPFAEVGTELDVEIRGKLRKAKVIKTPFYRK